MANYDTEREGQIEFYKTFLPLIDPNLTLDDILADDNDGVLNGNLLEFKLRVNDLNAVLFQCVKYLSALRIKGKPVPANIVIIDLNAEQAYLYKSANYLNDIEKYIQVELQNRIQALLVVDIIKIYIWCRSTFDNTTN